MSPEKVEFLVTTYPEMFKTRRAHPTCGDGWFPLIRLTCELIHWPIQSLTTQVETCKSCMARGVNPDMWNPLVLETLQQELAKEVSLLPEVRQIKEKFGTLRFYISGGSDRTHGLVQFAEAMSALLCEECGDKGTTRPGDTWVSTLCAACRRARDLVRDLAEKE